MLVLTRRVEEKIVIGEDNQVVITILKIQGDRVSIGIKADRDIRVIRKELEKEKVEEEASATNFK